MKGTQCFDKVYTIAWVEPKAYVMKSAGCYWSLETGLGILLGGGSRHGEGVDKLLAVWWKKRVNSECLRSRPKHYSAQPEFKLRVCIKPPATAWEETLLTEQPRAFNRELLKTKMQRCRKTTSWLAVAQENKAASSVTEAKSKQLAVAGAF